MKHQHLGTLLLLGVLAPACGGELDAGGALAVGETQHALGGRVDFDRCADVLADGLRDEFETSGDSETRGILVDWVCDRGRTNFDIDHEGSFGFMGFGGDQDWSSTREKIKDYCEHNERSYKASSFTYHALSRVANQAVVEAWRDCMTSRNQEPFLCEPRERHGVVAFDVSWNTIDAATSLDLIWSTQLNVTAAGQLPAAMGEGTIGGDFTIDDPSRPAQIRLIAQGERAGGGIFQYTCDVGIDPIRPVVLRPRVQLPPINIPDLIARLPFSLKAASKCLNERGALATCNGSAQQQWVWHAREQLKNRATGTCLDTRIAAGGFPAGLVTEATLRPCVTSDASQDWTLDRGRLRQGSSRKCLRPSGSRNLLKTCTTAPVWTREW